MTRKISAALCAAALVAALGACGDATGVTGSGDARMQVAAQGDDAPGASASRAPDGAGYSHSSASGTVAFRARVWVQTSAGAWVELTNRAAQQATVDASGHAGAVVFAASDVEAGAYGRVRVVFEDVRANVSGGIQVGTGLLTGSVTVDLAGDGSVTVERQVSVSASAGATTRLLINLNSDVWLSQASASTRTVSEAAFASAVQVTAG